MRLFLTIAAIYFVMAAVLAGAILTAPACTAGDPTARCAAVLHHDHHVYDWSNR